jgi:DNA-binding MarR family transcriptional regulator
MPGDSKYGHADSLARVDALQLVQVLARASRRLRQQLFAAALPHDLSEAQWQLLWLFDAHAQAASSQNDLAQSLGVSPAQVSSVVEQLRHKGLVAGQRSLADRRRQCWQLTAAGEASLRQMAARLDAYAQSLLARLGPIGLGQLIQELERLMAALADGECAARRSDARDIPREEAA